MCTKLNYFYAQFTIPTDSISVFFCHPYHSWEKGTNENTNGLVRRYLPRGSSLENISKAPKTKRETVLDFKTELDIKHIRAKYIRLGKVKLQKLFKDEYGCYVSQNHISYVIQKYNLYFVSVGMVNCA